MNGVDVVGLARQVSEQGAEIKNLVGWQESQNGAIHRVEAKVDKLIWWIATTAAVQLLALAAGLLFFLLKEGI